MPDITPERLRELIEYDKENGILIVRKTGRKTFPDENGTLIVFDKKSYRFKYEKLCVALLNGKYLEPNERVLFKNMQKDDFRAINLKVVTKEEYLLVKEAYRNLTSGIRYDHHHKDKLQYVVQYYEDGTLKHQIIADLGKVKNVIRELRVKYSKIITKYCIFDE